LGALGSGVLIESTRLGFANPAIVAALVAGTRSHRHICFSRETEAVIRWLAAGAFFVSRTFTRRQPSHSPSLQARSAERFFFPAIKSHPGAALFTDSCRRERLLPFILIVFLFVAVWAGGLCAKVRTQNFRLSLALPSPRSDSPCSFYLELGGSYWKTFFSAHDRPRHRNGPSVFAPLTTTVMNSVAENARAGVCFPESTTPFPE